ncbi:uncharacterized protein CC84DRAFT_965979 [Paraphaeosphaeria sporulosa]|uniref:Uncharacterized protein n=1 Tax=Paraphaeosphaeria sporulosa TaxID=1460663 RepID=A0A177C945_9PLEO|nr:uncharacterized protein CC84DRAFT_965979 [Paraphaeosphaeria sporulosa]OAG03298.1 hypothetical protein CC84DRAFT_965979 [Paraphaeosphaeria sporulosa]
MAGRCTMYMCIHMYFSTSSYQNHFHNRLSKVLTMVKKVPARSARDLCDWRLAMGRVAQSRARSLGELAPSAATFTGFVAQSSSRSLARAPHDGLIWPTICDRDCGCDSHPRARAATVRRDPRRALRIDLSPTVDLLHPSAAHSAQLHSSERPARAYSLHSTPPQSHFSPPRAANATNALDSSSAADVSAEERLLRAEKVGMCGGAVEGLVLPWTSWAGACRAFGLGAGGKGGVDR